MATLPLAVVVVAAAGWSWPAADAFWSRPLPGITSAHTTFISNISDVPSPTPRLANHTEGETTEGAAASTGASEGGGTTRVVGMKGQVVSALVPLTDCNRTYLLDDGQAALLFSRHDKYGYECNQTFEAVNMDGNLNLICHHLALKFNCFMESLTITTDDQETTYCLQDKMDVQSGKRIKVQYRRRMGGVNGGYVCTIAAHTPMTSKVQTRLCANCGVSASMDKEAKMAGVLRVVGGETASKDEYPWAVFLVLKMSNSRYRCGGSLITDTLVLSAAHCFAGYTIESIQVGVGQVDVTATGEVGAQWYTTTKYEIHPQYDDQTFENDLALVILTEPVTFSQAVRPVCLPSHDLPMEGYTATAMGWGALSYGGPLSQTLQEVQLVVWSNADCQTAWRKKFGTTSFEIVASQVCAAASEKDTCNGDSGGPLIVKGTSHRKEKAGILTQATRIIRHSGEHLIVAVGGRWELLGVTSYGYKCAEEGMAGVYTRVSKYINWINKFIPDTYCQDAQ